MKPIKLKLSGLNSYIEEQVIDFEKLVERGLFGIFGETGSGKSTVLDAITIAMYGQISRNTKEYINSSCDRAHVSYEFEIGKARTRTRYIVERTIRRKKDGGVQTSVAKLIEIDNENKNVLADKTTEVNKLISEIVGLTAEDFTRSVVLPQGKFNDFLKLTGSDRRNMLERIFNLEKYGRSLIEKIRINKSRENYKLTEINGKLSQHEDISQELYDDIKLEFENIKKEEKILKENQAQLKLKQNEYKEIYENQINLKTNLDRKKVLEEKDEEIEKKKRSVEYATKAEKINPYIDETLKLKKSVLEYETESEEIDKNIFRLKQELIIIKDKYDRAVIRKNNEVLVLIREKSKIEESLKLEKEVLILDDELKNLRTEYKLKLDEKEKLEKQQNILKERLSSNEVNLRDISLKIEQLKIPAKLKEQIFRAYELEKEYRNLKIEKNQANEKNINYNNELDKLKFDYNEISNKKLNLSKKIENSIAEYDKIIQKKPGDNNLIIEKTEYINIQENKFNIAQENNNKKEELKIKYNEILKVKYKLECDKKLIEEKIDINQKNIADTNTKLNEANVLNRINEIRKELKENVPCPVCGSISHNIIENHSTDEIEILKNSIEQFQIEEIKLKKIFESINNEFLKVSYEKENIDIQIQQIKKDLEDIDINRLKNFIIGERKKLESLKESLILWEKNKEILEKNISIQKEEKTNIDVIESGLIQNIQNKKNQLQELQIILENINKTYPSKKEEYLTLKFKIQVEDIAKKVDEINNNEKQLEQYTTDLDKLNIEHKTIEEQLKVMQESIHKFDVQLVSLKDVGDEKKKSREEKNKELILITRGENPAILLEKIKLELNKIIKDEELLKIELENKNTENEKSISKKNLIDGSKNQAIKQLDSQQNVLEKMLIEHKFEDIYEVKKYILDPQIMKNLIEDISSYEEEIKTLNIKIIELECKLNNKSITKEEYDEIIIQNETIRERLEKISEQKGAYQNKLNEIELKLKNIKEILKEKTQVENKVRLLEDLDKLVQGNKFVEYVATNQLKYIALEASKRLKKITKGRYALELDSTGNFVMRDDFNGGIRRSVDTLSGGETFLTSLSLALALSSQIQLKGSAPLEFFFLDEGFGTLDNSLLETVLQSLERLHNDKLSVGIISHVDELKNRVPVKLIVKSNESGIGSKVNIEYS